MKRETHIACTEEIKRKREKRDELPPQVNENFFNGCCSPF
jgi:hypothetical protein